MPFRLANKLDPSTVRVNFKVDLIWNVIRIPISDICLINCVVPTKFSTVLLEASLPAMPFHNHPQTSSLYICTLAILFS